MKPSSSARVAVCIPTFNRSAYLRRAIESVLGQTFGEYSILVSDNASSDDTAEVVAAFDDPRISYVRMDQNVGWLGNFNASLDRVDAEFVVVLGDDDQLLPTFLE